MAHPNRAAEIVFAVVSALAISAHAAAQESSRAPKWYAEAAVAIARPFVEDENGTTVKPSVAPVVGIAAAWLAGAGTMLTLGLQGSGFTLRLEDGGASWDGGRAFQVDLMGGVEREIAGCAAAGSRGCTSGRLAVGGTWLRGSDDVLPFRFGGAGLHPAGEVGLAVRLAKRPLSAIFKAHAFRLGGGRTDDPISEPGTALQFRIGARYGL